MIYTSSIGRSDSYPKSSCHNSSSFIIRLQLAAFVWMLSHMFVESICSSFSKFICLQSTYSGKCLWLVFVCAVLRAGARAAAPAASAARHRAAAALRVFAVGVLLAHLRLQGISTDTSTRVPILKTRQFSGLGSFTVPCVIISTIGATCSQAHCSAHPSRSSPYVFFVLTNANSPCCGYSVLYSVRVQCLWVTCLWAARAYLSDCVHCTVHMFMFMRVAQVFVFGRIFQPCGGRRVLQKLEELSDVLAPHPSAPPSNTCATATGDNNEAATTVHSRQSIRSPMSPLASGVGVPAPALSLRPLL